MDSLNQGMIERLAGPMIIRSGSTVFDHFGGMIGLQP
jgi:hypothetical protein